MPGKLSGHVLNKTLANHYLEHEIDHAWTHYRHLEEMRYKYLSVVVTLLTASVAAFTAGVTAKGEHLFPEKGPPTTPIVAGMSCFLFLLFIWSGLFLTAIIRIGFVLKAYEDVMIATREHFCGFKSNAYELWDVRGRIPTPIKGKFFSLQENAVVLLFVVCVFLALLELSLAWWLWKRTAYIYRIPAGCTLVMVLTLFSIFISNFIGNRRKQKSSTTSQREPSPYVPLTAMHTEKPKPNRAI